MKKRSLIKCKSIFTSVKKLCLVFSAATVFLFSCNKEEFEIPVQEPATTAHMETAFTNEAGEIITIELSNGESLFFKKVSQGYLFEGDILFSEEQIEQIKANAKLKGTAAFDSKTWKNNTVPYVINSNMPSNKKRMIKDAIKHVENKTKLDFVKRSNQSDYIEFINSSSGMWSSGIGRLGGKQQIGFADWGSKGNCVHEICHAVGMWHEQSRLDRDDHITIYWDNISENGKYQYRKLPSNQGFDVGSFDFGSIMIYSPYGFAIDNSKPAMTKKDGSTWVAQRNGLSGIDIQALNAMYK